jgi:aminoglycoside 3-N-acetyltransferase
MINKKIVFKTLSKLGLSPSSVVMIHGDAGPAAQIKFKQGQNKLHEFIKIIVSFFSKGIVLVPTYTYSSINSKSFDPDTSKSELGQFSEFFRTYPGVVRTAHPIFSFAIYGKNKDQFLNTKLSDCFGDGTIFDKFYKLNGKILCIGCSIDRSTFAHYVEQKIGVSYRYFKNFNFNLIVNGLKTKLKTSYFVRKLSYKTEIDLSLFKINALKSNSLKQLNIGRFPIICISSRNFFRIAKNLYNSNPYSLIKGKKNNE